MWPPQKAKERITVSLPVELIERLRNAVYWTPGLTLAKVIEEAVAESLDRMERKNGEPFPRRMEKLKGGRPQKQTTVSEEIHPRIQSDKSSHTV